jgi:hypothetical protein
VAFGWVQDDDERTFVGGFGDAVLYLGLVPPCVVQGRCETTYADLHTTYLAKGEKGEIDASTKKCCTAIIAGVYSRSSYSPHSRNYKIVTEFLRISPKTEWQAAEEACPVAILRTFNAVRNPAAN